MIVIYKYIQEGRFKSVFLSAYKRAFKKQGCLYNKQEANIKALVKINPN